MTRSDNRPTTTPAATVPCEHCGDDLPARTFTFLPSEERLVTAPCAPCASRSAEPDESWLDWAPPFVPDLAPSVTDLDVAGAYIPGSAHGEPTAGDFFDVVKIDPGRVLIAVGDVSGHGAHACRRMKQLRAATHAIAARVESPGELISRLDVLQREGPPDDIATIWVGSYNPRTGVLPYASAGHVPPVIAGFGDRTILLADAAAPPLGTGVVSRFAQVDEIFVPKGAHLVVFTDGLVERPDQDLDAQLDRLRELVERTHGGAASSPPPQDLLDTVLAELVPDPASARDDVCLLVLRRGDQPGPGQLE